MFHYLVLHQTRISQQTPRPVSVTLPHGKHNAPVDNHMAPRPDTPTPQQGDNFPTRPATIDRNHERVAAAVDHVTGDGQDRTNPVEHDPNFQRRIEKTEKTLAHLVTPLPFPRGQRKPITPACARVRACVFGQLPENVFANSGQLDTLTRCAFVPPAGKSPLD